MRDDAHQLFDLATGEADAATGPVAKPMQPGEESMARGGTVNRGLRACCAVAIGSLKPKRSAEALMHSAARLVCAFLDCGASRPVTISGIAAEGDSIVLQQQVAAI